MAVLISHALHPSGFKVMIAFDKISTKVMTALLWWTPTMVSPSIGPNSSLNVG